MSGRDVYRRALDTQPGYRISHRLPGCAGGPCEQGDKPCPSPQACGLAEARADGTQQRSERIALALIVVVLIVLAVLIAFSKASK